MVGEIQIFPLEGIPEVKEGDDLVEMILSASRQSNRPLLGGDILVVTQKIVSKAEGQFVDLKTIEPSVLAREFASAYDKDPRHVEIVLRESARIVRMDRGIIIAETRHGLVCANAGVDASNVPGSDIVCLLPKDPDASALRLRLGLREAIGGDLAVIISDSFGRPWRLGITNIAIGLSGLEPLVDYRGQKDKHGYELSASIMAVADEIAAAAELVMGKIDERPLSVVRGYPYTSSDSGQARSIIMEPGRDMFR